MRDQGPGAFPLWRTLLAFLAISLLLVCSLFAGVALVGRSPTVTPTATPADALRSPTSVYSPTSSPTLTATPPRRPTPTALAATPMIAATEVPVTLTTPAARPTPTTGPTFTPAPPPVAVWEGTITLPTYGWEQALVPTTPDDPAYPHPRLDFSAVTGPAPRTYGAVFIQNEYAQLVVVPELGGRILRWVDRTTGRQLFYANPVVKPTRWGYRGWWLATGGMEWAFPTEEHGLNEYRPWQYQLLWNGVRVWNTEDRTGMTVEVTIQLSAGSSRVAITPHITNPTDQVHRFQFWANAMLTLSDSNSPSPDLTFVLPASQVILHSTGDGSLPAPGSGINWPVHAGRDFSRYSEWRSYLGVFAPQAADAGFAGAYDLGTDQGIVRVAPSWVRGVKIFCLGDLGSELWTDDGSRYFELWGGLTPTFWDETTLQPGGSVAWTEHWYAVSGMGGTTWANAEAAVRLAPTGDAAQVAVETVTPRWVTVILRRGEAEVDRWETTVGPGQPLRTTSAAGGSGAWWLQVFDSAGSLLIQVGP